MKKNILAIIAMAAVAFTSCDSLLDIEPQGGSVSDEQLQQLINTDADKVLAPMMLGMVNYMHNGYYSDSNVGQGYMNWNLAMDLQANDMVLSSTANWWGDQYTFENLRQQTARFTAERWYCYYKMVYKANQILDLIPADATGQALVYKAQALTFRALAYYYLVNIYQTSYMYGGKDMAGVPMYLSTGDPTTGRTPVETIYTQIVTDLQTAVAAFETTEYDSHQTFTDIDGSVANMVLARVALTCGKYDIAATAAGKVIADGYTLMGEEEYTTSGFQEGTLSETLWAYDWAQATSLENASFASWISKTAIDTGSNKGIYMCIDQQLYDQIPDTDYRKKNFVKEAEGNYPAYIAVKFNSANYRQDEVYMRLSEAYLLKAEAEARNNQASAAQTTLYNLVSQRDSAYEKSSKTGDALLKEIFLQSRIELWGEGHEWFTNKRFNVGVDRTASANHGHKVKFAAGKEFTYQIPLSIELNSNPNIKDQNPL